VIQIFKYEETQIASAASYSGAKLATATVSAAIAEVVADGYVATDAKAVAVVVVGGIRRGDRGRRADDVR